MEHEINILVVEPGKAPRPARVDYSLETFSQIVGGELAMGCFLPQRVMLLYNEDKEFRSGCSVVQGLL